MSSDRYHVKRYNGPGHHWTVEELDWMAENVPGTLRSVAMERFAERFGWTPTLPQWNGICVKHGFKARRCASWYEQGHDRATNKGKTWDEYMSKESQAAVREKSALNPTVPMYGISTQNHQVNIKVPADICKLFGRALCNGKDYGFVAYPRYVWWQATGHVPKRDECIVHRDNDWSNNDIANLDLVQRNVYHILQNRGWTAETYDACKARAALEDALKRYGHMCPACGEHFVAEFRDQQYCRRCIDDGTQRRMTQEKIADTRRRKHGRSSGAGTAGQST